MYWLFRYKDITPLQFKSMGKGEKIILRAFMKTELEQRRKEEEARGYQA